MKRLRPNVQLLCFRKFSNQSFFQIREGRDETIADQKDTFIDLLPAAKENGKASVFQHCAPDFRIPDQTLVAAKLQDFRRRFGFGIAYSTQVQDFLQYLPCKLESQVTLLDNACPVDGVLIRLSEICLLQYLQAAGKVLDLFHVWFPPHSLPGPLSEHRAFGHSAFVGHSLTHSPQRMHSVPFRRFLFGSMTLTSIGQTLVHFPQEMHFSGSGFTRIREK